MENLIAQRVARLRDLMHDTASDTLLADTLLVLTDENRRYMSGFTGQDTQFDESAGALLVSRSDLILLTDTRYELQAQQEAPLFEIVCYKKGLAEELPALLLSLGTKTLGFESVRLSVHHYRKISEAIAAAGLEVKLEAVEDLVAQLRIRKAPREIDTLRRALSIAEAAFTACTAQVKPGLTEKEVAWIMEKEMREAGAEGLSFPTIVAGGPNSALPHAIPGDRPIRAGEPLLFDWGARLDGYCSDISRTVVIGEPDATFEKVFQTVLEAQRRAIDAIRAGVSSRAVDAVARDYIEKQGFGGKFGHGLGHGTGLAIHEAPRLSPLKDTVLEAGMVTTVEPGIYLADWGGVRLENMVVVREDGAEVLNRLDPAAVRI
ncbi:MAG: aminopeptidase P family protein [Desulfobacterales bacterium]